MAVLGVKTGNYYRDLIKSEYPVIDRVIKCESGWDNSRKGKAGEIGIAQFMPSTFAWFSKESGFNGDIYNEEDQLRLTIWAFENGYSAHWTCYTHPY